MASLQDLAKQLQQAQAQYGAAKTAEEKAKAAALGQQIRQEAAKAGYSTSQLESAAQQVWKSSSPSAGSSTSSGSKSSGAVTYSGSKPVEGGGFYVTDASGKQVYVPPLTKETVEQVISGLSPQAQAQARQVASQLYPQWYGTTTQQPNVAQPSVEEVIRTFLEQYAGLLGQVPTVSYPEIPAYAPPPPQNLAGEPPLTWDEAMARAMEMVNPLAEAARARTIQMFQEQREKLPYQLAAKGQLTPSALRNAEQNLTQAQALALEQVDMQALAQALETARQLQATTHEQAAANLARAWEQWLAEQQAAVQRAQFEASQLWQQYEARRNILAQLIAWFLQQQGLEREDELQALQAALGLSPFVTNPLAFLSALGYWPAR